MYNFETNRRGGWIVPNYTGIADGVVIPPFSEFGNECSVGDRCTIGEGCEFGYQCTIGDECTIGNSCYFGHECTVGWECTIGMCCAFAGGELIGDHCAIGENVTFGENCTIGDGCTWLGVQMIDWLVMSNVGGSTPQIKIIKHADGVKIESGPFIGDLDEFVRRERNWGDVKCAAIVETVARVM